jgi:hypothetical protein
MRGLIAGAARVASTARQDAALAAKVAAEARKAAEGVGEGVGGAPTVLLELRVTG